LNSRNPYEQLKEVRDDIIDKALIIGFIVGILTYILSFLNYFISGFEISFVTDLIILVILGLIILYRKKISIQRKSYVILVSLAIVILIDVYELGILSANKILLVLVPFFTVTSFTLRRTAIFLTAIVSIMAFLGYLHIQGWIKGVEFTELGTIAWSINIILLVFVGIVLLLITLRFNSTYQRMISDIMANNQLIEESEKNYREIFNSASDVIIVFNMDGSIEEFNNSIVELLGFDEDISVKVLEKRIFREGSDSDFQNKFKRLIDKKNVSFDWQIQNEFGQLIWVEVMLKHAIIRNEPKIIGVFRDINEKKNTRLELEQYKNQLEEKVSERTIQLTKQAKELKSTISRLNETQAQLIHSEKMASVGLLASGIAHEINNPLNFIKGGIEALEVLSKSGKDLSKDPNFKELITGIKEGVGRASLIVKGLNQYGRSREDIVEDCNLNRIIENCLIMLKGELDDSIGVKLNFSDLNIVVKGNSGKIHQLFLNILTNAIHAIQEEGTVEVNTKVSEKYAEVLIKDNGVGIPKKHLKKISDPFFTTKEVGKGTGLGLYIVFNILKEHKGDIKIESEEGYGTSITIYLPFQSS